MPEHAVRLHDEGCDYCRPRTVRTEVDVGRDLIANDNQGVSLEDIPGLAAASTGPYDCVVGLSGGRDSVFLLYYAKKVLGLNPLAANFRTRLQTDEARHNIEDATSRLGVELYTYSPDDAFFGKLVRGFFERHGEFCSPCHKGHHYTLARAAAEHGIKLIIRGISSKIDLNRMNPGHFDHFCRSELELNRKIDAFGSDFGISEQELEAHRDLLHLERWKERDVRTIDLPDLLDWNYGRVQQVLDTDLDWIHPPKQFFHCDCRVNPTLCYLESCKHGYSEKQLIISNHLASAEFPLERGLGLLASEEVLEVPENIEQVLALLGVDRETFDASAERFWKQRRSPGRPVVPIPCEGYRTHERPGAGSETR